MKLTFKKVDWKQVPNKREKIVFFIALFVFIIGFFKSCWYPSHNAISEAKKDLKVVVNEKKELNRTLSLLSGSKENEKSKLDKEKRDRYIAWGKSLGEDPDVVLMRDYSNPAMLRGVSLNAVDFEEPNIQNGITSQKWNLSLSGSFMSLGSFLDRFENLPLLLIIDSVEMTRSKESLGHINLKLKGLVYGWK